MSARLQNSKLRQKRTRERKGDAEMPTLGELAIQGLESCLKDKPLSDRARQALARMKAEMAMSPEERRERIFEREKQKVDEYNHSSGSLKDGYTTNNINGNGVTVVGDGYNCDLCMNRGNTMGFRVDENGSIYEYLVPCRCMEIRKSIWRMRQSGLEKSIRENTFKRFVAAEPWQKAMLDMAKRYLAEGVKEGRWLYMGGQPGCGKTHLCTAVAGKLLMERPLIYVIWPQVSKRLKSIVTDAESYEKELGRLQTVDVLYIDDMFKPVTNDKGEEMEPSAPDKRLAFELINYRYVNRLPTIISSEWHIADLSDFDEATGSRIAERSDGFCLDISRDKQRNHRLKGTLAI